MNLVAISGRICNIKSNNTFVSFIIAVDRRYKAEGKPATDFIHCVAFGKTSDFSNKRIHKGTKIALTGKLQTRSYEKDGTKHFTTEIITENIELVEQ